MQDPISPSRNNYNADNIYVDVFLMNKPPPSRIRPDCVTCSEEFDSVCPTCLNCYDCCVTRDKNRCVFCGDNVPCTDLCDSCGMCCQPCCDCFDDMNQDEDGLPLRRTTPSRRPRRRGKKSRDSEDDDDYNPAKDEAAKRRVRPILWTSQSAFVPGPGNDDVVRPPSKARSYGPHAWEVPAQPRIVQLPNPAYEPVPVGKFFPSEHEHVYPDGKGSWSRDEGQ